MTVHVYRIDVEYPPGSRYPEEGWREWEPEGWEPDFREDEVGGLSEVPFQWPNVRLYLSKSGAEARASLLRKYGAKATVVRSLPVVWEPKEN